MKDDLKKLIAEWHMSLHMPGRTYWKLEGVTAPQVFFRHLPMIFPHGMTLLVEGLEISLGAKSLYEEHPAIYTQRVACDTLSPTPESYHVAFSAEFSDRLCRLIASQGLAAAFYHFKGYSQSEIVFTFHDAFEGELALSSSLNEDAVRMFADALGCSFEQAQFSAGLAELIAMDRILNPPSRWNRLIGSFKRQKSS